MELSFALFAGDGSVVKEKCIRDIKSLVFDVVSGKLVLSHIIGTGYTITSHLQKLRTKCFFYAIDEPACRMDDKVGGL